MVFPLLRELKEWIRDIFLFFQYLVILPECGRYIVPTVNVVSVRTNDVSPCLLFVELVGRGRGWAHEEEVSWK